MRKYWYTPQLMVPSTIEMETGNIMLGTWTRYFLSLTMLPDQIKVNWRVRPISKDPDQEGKEEIFKSPQEYMDWYNNLKKTYGKRIARKGLFRFAYDEDTKQFSYQKFTRASSSTKRKGCALKEEHDNPEPSLLANELYSKLNHFLSFAVMGVLNSTANDKTLSQTGTGNSLFD